MATTSPDNLKTPDAGDQYALVQDLGALADTVQNALVKRANSYTGTSAQRGAFTTAPEGVLWSDTNGARRLWRRTGGSWSSVHGGGVLLESPGTFLTNLQTLTLSEKVSEQPTGIVLVWSRYDQAANSPVDNNWLHTFVHKYAVGKGPIGVPLFQYASTGTPIAAAKAVILADTSVTGVDFNSVGSNRNFVLRAVLGV